MGDSPSLLVSRERSAPQLTCMGLGVAGVLVVVEFSLSDVNLVGRSDNRGDGRLASEATARCESPLY